MNACNREFKRISRNQEELILQQFSEILKMPDVKSLMLQMIMSSIFNVIDINRSQLQRSKFFLIHESKLKLFEWRCSEFMERLLASEHYIDVHKFDDPNSLSILKFLVDLASLKNLLREILNSSNRALDTMKDCLQNLTIQKDLKKKLTKYTQIFANKNKEFEKYVGSNKNEQKESEENLNNIIDNCMDEVLIIDPLIIRVKRNALKAQHEDFKTQLQMDLEQLHRSIADYKSRLVLDNSVHMNTMSLINLQIETLRNKVTFWSKKYNDDYDKYSLVRSNLKLTIKAIKSNYETLQNRLNYFRIELARIRSISYSRKKPKYKLSNPKSKVKRTMSPKSAGKKIKSIV